MITKEERAQLRLELSNARLGFPLPWRLGEYADIVDADGDDVADCVVENSFTGGSAEQYIVAAANATPRILDALDAVDVRITELEAAAQWRTMDTAPLDGTPVLVHKGFYKEGSRKGCPRLEVTQFHGFLAVPSELPYVAHWRWLPIPALPTQERT